MISRFEARNLKSHLEYIESADLVKGDVYFVLQFLDHDMLIPELRPVVFVGKDCEPGDAGILYFQDAETRVEGLDDGRQSGPETFDAVPEANPFVCGFEQALEGVMSCSLRQSGARPVNAAAALRFDARDLSSKAAFFEPGKFVEGEIYFLVGFKERNLLTPELHPVVFVGNDLDSREPGLVYFQDAESYLRGVRLGSGRATFYRFPKNDPSARTFEDALDELLRCSLRRANPV